MPKPAKSQKKILQYSFRTKLSPVRKNDTILKQWQNLLTVRKTWYNTQRQNLSTVRKRWYKTETGPKPVNRQKKDGTILKQCKNLPPARKRWYNTQTEPKPVSSQKKMVQYSNRAKHCHLSEKDGTILKQFQNLLTVRKR